MADGGVSSNSPANSSAWAEFSDNTVLTEISAHKKRTGPVWPRFQGKDVKHQHVVITPLSKVSNQEIVSFLPSVLVPEVFRVSTSR